MNEIWEKRLGERKKMNNGHYCTFVAVKNSKHCVFRFDDGYEKITDYSHFVNCSIGYKPKMEILVGQERQAYNGEMYKVIDEVDGMCTLEFENKIIKKYKRAAVKQNEVSSKIVLSWKEKYGVGCIIADKEGNEYEITRSDSETKTIDVKTLDGSVRILNTTHINIKQRKTSTRAEVIDRQRNGYKDYLSNEIDKVIGQEYTATNGKTVVVIGGDKLTNLTVRNVENGKEYEGVKHSMLNRGQWSMNGCSDCVREKNQYKVGLKTLTTAGYTAEIIKYVNAKKIFVRTNDENNSVFPTTMTAFRNGSCNPGDTKKANEASINEFTCLYLLEKFGFRKGQKGSMRYLEGFGNRELDIFNEKEKIAIEYDGGFHGKEDVIIKDIEKDKLCKENGIKIYRIRESEYCKPLNDGISKEYFINDHHPFTCELFEVIKNILIDCNINFDEEDLPNIENPDVRKDILKKYSKRTAFRRHIGEENYNNKGELMKIVDYRGCTDIDIMFGNGYCSYHRNYMDFKKGRVLCKYMHYGEVSFDSNGNELKVISKTYGQRVDILINGKNIVRDVCHHKFKRGRIR